MCVCLCMLLRHLNSVAIGIGEIIDCGPLKIGKQNVLSCVFRQLIFVLLLSKSNNHKIIKYQSIKNFLWYIGIGINPKFKKKEKIKKFIC